MTRYPSVLTTRLPREIAARLRELAEQDDRAPGALARRFIVEGLTWLEAAGGRRSGRA